MSELWKLQLIPIDPKDKSHDQMQQLRQLFKVSLYRELIEHVVKENVKRNVSMKVKRDKRDKVLYVIYKIKPKNYYIMQI